VSDYETIQKRRNIIVGIFVIVAFCALVWLISKFGDLPMTISKINSFDVRVQFPTAPGVQKDTPVRFCGYQIGRVTKVVPPEVMKDLKTGQFYHQTRVVLTIDRKYSDIPAGVEAKLMTRGLGSSYIELKLKHFDVNEPTGPVLAEGSLLQGSTGMTSEFFPEESQKKLDDLITGLNAFMSNANKILGDPNNK
jgi:ABC-type transporter Mla subunit MlaD